VRQPFAMDRLMNTQDNEENLPPRLMPIFTGITVMRAEGVENDIWYTLPTTETLTPGIITFVQNLIQGKSTFCLYFPLSASPIIREGLKKKRKA